LLTGQNGGSFPLGRVSYAWSRRWPGFFFTQASGLSHPGLNASVPGQWIWKQRGEVNQEELRVNERIRISPIRLIDDNGDQLGIVATDEARSMAADRGLDVVEVAPNARPPVCRLMDYGKFKYEQARKNRDAKKKQHVINVKEVKLRPKIETHDIDFKLRHARRFIEEGHKVKFTLMFRGREVTHPELGVRLLEQVKQQILDIAVVESDIRHEGRTMTLYMAPIKQYG
jgi:translation initiation factor IF-3